jgi:hypothetical protein
VGLRASENQCSPRCSVEPSVKANDGKAVPPSPARKEFQSWIWRVGVPGVEFSPCPVKVPEFWRWIVFVDIIGAAAPDGEGARGMYPPYQ